MKAHTHYIWMNTSSRQDLVNITGEIEAVVRESEVREGLCLVSAMHITAAIWVNDNEPGLWQDMLDWIEQLAPRRPDYRHHRTGEDNGDAHLKRSLLHHQVVLPITAGRLDLGPWETVFYAEFDGRRRKRVVVKVLGE